jgi:hypothetical protein
MSVLSVAQEVALKIGVEVPSQVYASTDRTAQELLAMISDAADMIANGHEWQVLKTIATSTGDGTTEAFNLPTDYERMLTDSKIWSSANQSPLTRIDSEDDWLEMLVNGNFLAINAWIIYGGQLNIKPALGSGVTAKYFYLSKNIWLAGSTPQAAITADTNTFRLDEKLLRQAVIWMWKASKGQAYGEQQADFEQRLARKVKGDTGARVLRLGTVRMPADVQAAYPRNI